MFKRLFLSSVSDQPNCGSTGKRSLRNWLRDELEETEYVCTCQELFIEQGVNTLQKIAEYIERDSEIVIHIVFEGELGSIPDPRYVHSLLHALEEWRRKNGGRSFDTLFPFLFQEDQIYRCIGWQRLTYTQWEAWLARFFGKRLLVFQFISTANIPVPSYERLPPYSLEQHLEYLQPEVGYHVTWDSQDQLVARLLKVLRKLEQRDLRSTTRVVSWPSIDVSGSRRIANRGDELHAFAALLNSQCRKNTIHLNGASGRGKTTVLFEMRRIVSETSGIIVAWFDLCTVPTLTSVADQILSIVAEELGTKPEKACSKQSPPYYRANHALDQLQRLNRPTILFIDSFDAEMSDCIDWIEEELIPFVGRTSNLRLVIAGQKALREQTERQGSVYSWELSSIRSPGHWETYLVENGVRMLTREAIAEVVAQFDGDPRMIDLILRTRSGGKNDE